MDTKWMNTRLYHRLKSVLIGVFSGEIATMVTLLLFAFLMLRMDIPLYLADTMIVLAGSVGGFLSGFICGYLLREKGLIFGAVCGGVQILILLFFSFGIHSEISPLFLVAKFAAILLCATLGGILGVNKKKKRVRY